MSLEVLACCRTDRVIDPDTHRSSLELPDLEGRQYGSPRAYERKMRADILLERGDLDGAAAALEQALKADPNDFLLLTDLARVLLAKGDTAQAKEHLARAISAEPTAQIAWVALADYHMAKGDLQNALASAQQGIRVDQESAEALIWLGAHHRDQNNFRLSISFYRKAVSIRPWDLSLLLEMAKLEMTLGHPEAATELHLTYLDRGGCDPAVVLRLASDFFLTGDTQRGIFLLEEFFQKGHDDPKARKLLIEQLLKDGHRQRALGHIHTMAGETTEDPEQLLRIAKWLGDAGRPWEARKFIVDHAGPAPLDYDLRLLLARLELKLLRTEVAALLLVYPSGDWPDSYQKSVQSLLSKIKPPVQQPLQPSQ